MNGHKENTKRRAPKAFRRGCEFVAVLAFLVFVYVLIGISKPPEETYLVASHEPAIENLNFEVESAGQDFSKFQHSNPMHARLPCLLCHKREDNSATPKFPGHSPCSGCHQQQFDAGNQQPFCYICHTTTGLKKFPGLKSFGASFNHATHTSKTNCATCHKPTRQGDALSIPSRLNAHITCYQCHGPRTEVGGRNIGSCGTCHQPGRLTRTPEFVRAYTTTPFGHAGHNNLNCTNCHTVRAGMARGRQVSSPAAMMHFAPARAQSCASCHNNQRAFGGTDFDDCKRCHQRGNSFRF